jgi:lipopolysaccharide export system ATP-binding protein
MSIVVVEHNLKSLLEITNRAYILAKGKVVAEGEPQHLIGTGILEKVFLGKLE